MFFPLKKKKSVCWFFPALLSHLKVNLIRFDERLDWLLPPLALVSVPAVPKLLSQRTTVTTQLSNPVPSPSPCPIWLSRQMSLKSVPFWNSLVSWNIAPLIFFFTQVLLLAYDIQRLQLYLSCFFQWILLLKLRYPLPRFWLSPFYRWLLNLYGPKFPKVDFSST